MRNNPKIAKKMKVTLELWITDEDVDDIMSGALDECGYWCRRCEVAGEYLGEYASDQISRGGTLIFHLAEPFDKDDTKEYELTAEKLYKGIKMYAEQPTACNCLEQIDGHLQIDCCNADGEVCDAIIQYALFGEIIFG